MIHVLVNHELKTEYLQISPLHEILQCHRYKPTTADRDFEHQNINTMYWDHNLMHVSIFRLKMYFEKIA